MKIFPPNAKSLHHNELSSFDRIQSSVTLGLKVSDPTTVTPRPTPMVHDRLRPLNLNFEVSGIGLRPVLSYI